MRSHTHACAPPPFDSRTHSRDVREGERQGAREKEATSSEVREELNEKKEGKGKRDRASARRTKRVEGRYKAKEYVRRVGDYGRGSLRVRRQESWWGPGVALIGSAHFPLRATCSFGRHKRSVRICQVCFAEKRGCADGNDDEIGTSFAPLTAADWNDSRRDESKHIPA